MLKALISVVFFLFSTVSFAGVSKPDDVSGTWYLDIHQTLKEVSYREGPRYFDYKNIIMKVNSDASEAEFSGIKHAFFEKGFDATIRKNKLVLERKKSLFQKAMDKATGDDKFNYKKKKILFFKKKNRLIAKVRPDKGEKEMELVFTRNENPKPKKAFKVKYGTRYLSEEPIQGQRCSLTFNKNGQAEITTHRGQQTLPFTIAWSKKVFLGEGEYLVKSFSKALNLYSVEEDAMFAFFPEK